MSFEGYYQTLCKNGHEGSTDCYFTEPEEIKCSVCGEKIVWWNLVNTTNGSYDEFEGKPVRIDGYIDLEIDKPAEYCNCDKCGVRHLVNSCTYKIPKEGGHLLNESDTKSIITESNPSRIDEEKV